MFAQTTPMTARPMHWRELLALLLCVFLACLAGIATRPIAFMATFWPANGLLLGLLLRNPGWALTPLAWGMAYLGYLMADALTGAGWQNNLVINAINMVGVYAGWRFLSRQGPATLGFRRQRSVLLILVGCMISALTSGVLGTWARSLFFESSTWETFAMWTTGEAFNLILAVPLVLAAPRGWLWQWPWAKVLAPLRRAWGLPLVALFASEAVAYLLGGPGALGFAVPAMVWCAMVYGVFPTALLNLVTALWGTAAMTQLGLSFVPQHVHDAVSFRVGVAMLSLAPLAVATAHTLHKQTLQILHRAVNHDFLTGALSRRALMERGDQQLQRLQREGTPVATLMLDLDHFKRVNDQWGHAQGDLVLQQFASLITRNLRPGELFGRIGGEEFALLLPNTTREQALGVSERLCTQLREHVFHSETGQGIAMTMSIGLHAAQAGHDSYQLGDMLARADAALYLAKTSGRDQVQVYEGERMTPLRRHSPVAAT
ncbi:MAG: diguanylate cyclase [Comamonadaceae bacterium]|nr:diguanylate cyclase [Burkholderiales bacterium]MEB2347206.1 diguanylate cyclase [Comamonadaceae bacterium]